MPNVTVGLPLDIYAEIKVLARSQNKSFPKMVDAIFSVYKKCQSKVSEPMSQLSEMDVPLVDNDSYTGKQIKDWLVEKGILKQESQDAH